ncbi:transcriptional regulator [Vibrio inusitatus NBRC 102082]|uniref:Glycine cleavage system transcriptional repressor n=1 Tax=Vibrio inusitatus NBRC 102082 TaxID=1219070 RepID=A0A4Y3HVA2_9VIBR|nr:ACT domain-containing protein [Vibrio inusitatus]GEA51016.1 transcriptional regulator [Vibrio inusitatus NBRC 102082]
MHTTFIVNFIGTASPSTIKRLSAITHENGGKWLISKVNFIDHQVAGVIKVDLPEDNQDVVKNAFKNTEALVCQFTDADASLHDKEEIFSLRVDSNDRAGIVNEITQVLDGQGISILDMDCHRVFLAGGGGVSSSLFTAELALKLPAELAVEDVTRELESLSEDTRVVVEA